MPHDTPLIAAIVGGIVLAFLLGAAAHRLRISPLVGYLLAGVMVGPFTPGFVADQGLIAELAEIGVILLMFGVGLHFSLKDLLSVKAIAVPGAIAQIMVATALGWALAWLLGWSTLAGLVFGLALSVASTVVLLRALQERRLLDTTQGRIAVGWLVVEDIFMVAVLVLLPPLAEIYQTMDQSGAGPDAGALALTLAITMGKVAAFVAIMLLVGRRVVPWILHYIAHTGSRELFRLAVLSIALGIAFGASILFGVSFALGAFFAGMILSESELSHQAAQETLPLRDAFAVLFFVSVGMLLDPVVLVEQFWPLLATLGIILFGKSVAAFVIVRLFRHPKATALVISASLAQIGEFSFILAGLGLGLGILPEQAQDLILAGAIISILINPAFFVLLDRFAPKEASDAATPEAAARRELTPTLLSGHYIVVGHGRVGSVIEEALRSSEVPMLVIEDHSAAVANLDGVEVIKGNAADPEVLAAANPSAARCIFVAVPDAFEAGTIVEQARAANPSVPIIARAHSEAEHQHLTRLGATHTVLGERELALEMLRKAGVSNEPSDAPPTTP
ncbi:MAG: Kef family K(+) transporter [Rhodospirillum sp.]|nr:Kef family K(+) transporter [Rhodospirillum sp.]